MVIECKCFIRVKKISLALTDDDVSRQHADEPLSIIVSALRENPFGVEKTAILPRNCEGSSR